MGRTVAGAQGFVEDDLLPDRGEQGRVDIRLFEEDQGGAAEMNQAIAGPVAGGFVAKLCDIGGHAGVKGGIPLRQGKHQCRHDRHQLRRPRLVL